MKSICFFTYDLSIGGAEKVVIHLANYLVEKGNNVTLLSVSKGNDLEEIIDKNIKIVSLNSEKIRKVIPSLIRFSKTNEIDFFIANMWPLTIVSCFIKLFSRETRLLFIEHSVISEEFKDKNFLFKLLQNISIRLFYNLAEYIISVSEGIKKDLMSRGIKASKLKVIYNPLCSSPDFQKIEYPKEFDAWKSGKKTLISVGELKKSKNFQNLIKAVEIYNSSHPSELKVLILGDGPERSNLEDLIKQKQLQEIFLLPGWVTDPSPYLKEADIFVLSSDYEGFGLVITEALSVGITVVSTDCNFGPREILQEGEYGYLCRIDDPKDLCKAIKRSLKQPIQKDKLFKRANDFSLSKIGKKYEELLKY